MQVAETVEGVEGDVAQTELGDGTRIRDLRPVALGTEA